MMKRLQSSTLAPWVGLLVAPAAWAVDHQVGSDLVMYDCRLADGTGVLALGVAMAVLSLAAGLVSWISRPAAGARQLRAFVAYLGAMAGALFFMALAYQTLAVLMLPACHR